MEKYSVSNIATIINANLLLNSDDDCIEHLLIDSRKLMFPKTSLFFAIKGPRRTGADFISQLYDEGVRNFVIEKEVPKENIINYPDANFLLVDDVLSALQNLSAFHRNQFQFPVIGITGSNGKTIIKEWLYQSLHTKFNIVRSPKSYNSQIGVPMSVWQMKPENNLALFEVILKKLSTCLN